MGCFCRLISQRCQMKDWRSTCPICRLPLSDQVLYMASIQSRGRGLGGENIVAVTHDVRCHASGCISAPHTEWGELAGLR